MFFIICFGSPGYGRACYLYSVGSKLALMCFLIIESVDSITRDGTDTFICNMLENTRKLGPRTF